ncbi:MAG: DNA polymerase III subunit alpha [Magnetococcales bacterium]|nr:DNA polymerase III subunit alpha [Magnetococcales bacterium]
MSHAPFVHLHVHSGYSLLNSTIRLEQLVGRASEERMAALALTDQGNLFAAIQFYSGCLNAGIKPILGAQVYLVPDLTDKSQREDKETQDELILLCRNEAGWRNLMVLTSVGHQEGSHGRPRIDHRLLARHCDGLLALSAGRKGAVGRLLALEKPDAAREEAIELAALFKDPATAAQGFYLELHRQGLPDDEFLVQQTLQLALELDIPIVASNNVHFMDPADQKAHHALRCIGLGQSLFEQKQVNYSDQFHFASAQEMANRFADLPEAVENSLLIAQRCNLQLNLGQTVLPNYQLPEGEDLSSWLRRQSEEGLASRLDEHVLPRFSQSEQAAVEKRYKDRLGFELDVILQMGFPGYFLIVSDFIRWAKKEKIPVGPGRGSGAGSLVAWSLDITDLDPIRYQLLFERFLNPERVSMPDFDVDFCMDRRGEVIHYVQEKYGEDRVAQIITFGTLQSKMVIRDVGRVLQMPYGQVDRIAKLVPNLLGITLKKAIDQEERLRTLIAEDQEVADLIKLALALEGLPRSCGTHAAGVVMANGPLTDMVPLYLDPRSPMPVTQFNMIDVERAGLVKFDFLGLKTLTVIHEALRLINGPRRKEGLDPVDINTISLTDQATFKLLMDGRSKGVFQLESSGMREILKKLAPDTFEDIIALVALYRPGPLGSGMVEDFINRKHKRVAVEYPLPQLEPILNETYGVILYQEQVMKIAQVLAGYSLGGADMLRRAMGKKKLKEMESQRAIFMKGSAENNIEEKKAAYIFDLMEKFAGYGFNKSHSAAYALISYQTAWLKAHYPVEFMAATLTCDKLNTDKVTLFVRECREMGVTVLPPDINGSIRDFSVEKGMIRYGLAAIKNVGEGVVDAILEERNTTGKPFKNLYDLCQRAATAGLNRRMMENLIKSGGCDGFSDNRAALLKALPSALSQGSKRQQESSMGYLDLFSELDRENEPQLPDAPQMSEETLLGFEKEALGFYMSGHPMRKYLTELSDYGILDSDQIKKKFGPGANPQDDVRISGVIVDKKLHRTKKGDQMAFITLEDMVGQIEVIAFSEVFSNCRDALDDEGILVVIGTVEPGEEEPKMMATEIVPLAEFRNGFCRELRLTISAEKMTGSALDDLARLFRENSGGNCRVIIRLKLEEANVLIKLGENYKVTPNESLLSGIIQRLGTGSATYSATRTLKLS